MAIRYKRLEETWADVQKASRRSERNANRPTGTERAQTMQTAIQAAEDSTFAKDLAEQLEGELGPLPGQIQTALGEAAAALEESGLARSEAATAVADASAAVADATQAIEDAGLAQAAADGAATAASDAQTVAGAAQLAADAAETAAVAAASAAAAAGSDATDALADAEAARLAAVAAQAKADQAFLDAANAATAAGNAQTAANGKNRVWYQGTAPAGTGHNVDDVWFDTDQGNRMSRWTGSIWAAVEFGGAALANSAVTAIKLADDAVTAAKLATGAVDDDALSTAVKGAITTAQSTAENAATVAGGAQSAAAAAQGAATAAQGDADQAIADALAAAALAAGKGRVWAQDVAPPAGRTFEWAGPVNASESVEKLDGVEVRRNRYVASGIGFASGSSIVIGAYSGGYMEVAPGEVVSFARFGEPEGNRFQYGFTEGIPSASTPLVARVNRSNTTTEETGVVVPDGVTHLAMYFGNNTANARGFATSETVNPLGNLFDGSTPSDRTYDLWINTTDGKNTPNRWVNGGWEVVTDKAATDAAAAAVTAKNAADAAQGTATAAQGIANAASAAAGAAQTAADAAASAASAAQSTANGRAVVVRSTSAATAAGSYKLGDQWWQFSGANIIGLWLHTGSAWQVQTLTNAIIATLDAGKITTGFLAAARIEAATITGTHIAGATVTASNMVAGTITAASGIIANATIGTAQIIDLAVSGAKLANATITNAKIADATIESAKIATLDAAKITTGTLAAARIAALSITTGHLAANAVTAAKIAALTITAAEIAANAVTAVKIAADAVTAEKINAGAVTTNKLDALAVTAEKIAAGAIIADKIKANAITTAKLAVDAIDGMTITGALIRTAPTGQRMQFDINGMRAFDASGAVTSTLFSGVGGMQVTGQFGVRDAGGTRENRLTYGDLTLTGDSHTAKVDLGGLAVIRNVVPGVFTEHRFDRYGFFHHWTDGVDTAQAELRLLNSTQGSVKTYRSELRVDWAAFPELQTNRISPLSGVDELVLDAPKVSFQGEAASDSYKNRSGGISAPYAIAAGAISNRSVAAGGASNVTVTFPVGRFTEPPIVVPGLLENMRDITTNVTNRTKDSFTFNFGSMSSVARTVGGQWQAIQMTPTSGAG